MNAYSYSNETGEYLGAVNCQVSPLEPGEFLVPAHSTALPPPGDLQDDAACVWNGSTWEIVIDNRGKNIYLLTDSRITDTIKELGDSIADGYTLTAPPDNVKQYIFSDNAWTEKPKTQEEIISEYEMAVDNHINEVARANDFDSILTCTKYAGFDNPFRAHAEALLAWNANCWINCHTLLDAIIAGTSQPPTIDELLAELPAFVWNNNNNNNGN